MTSRSEEPAEHHRSTRLPLPPHDHSGLDDVKRGTPPDSQPQQENPESAVDLPKSRTSVAVLEDRVLLPQSNVLQCERGPRTDDCADQAKDDESP